jgi:hypothetical protein
MTEENAGNKGLIHRIGNNSFVFLSLPVSFIRTFEDTTVAKQPISNSNQHSEDSVLGSMKRIRP